MRTLLAVSSETFLRLRRDRIFVPALIIGVGLLGIAGLASYWGVVEFFKILYDLGSTAYLMTGATVAIFWGNKIVSDSRQEGSLEVQLASPIGRSTWLIGKFLGLAAALILLAIGFLIAWQLIFLAWGLGPIGKQDFVLFGLLTCSWLVLATLSILFACLASPAIALFCTVWMFVAGLLSGPISQALSPETPESTRKVVEMFAGAWNFQTFNITQHAQQKSLMDLGENLYRLGYAAGLIGLFLALACLVFQKRDIIAS